MIKKDISYHKRYEYNANLSTMNKEFQGTLEFSGDSIPSFATDSILDVSCEYFEELKKSGKITCSADGEIYTLFNVDSLGNILYPEYLIKGEDKGSVTAVEILLTGFSTWINQKTSFDFESNENQIIKHLHDYKISENVFIGGREYSIESNLCYQTKRLEKQNYLISEYTTIIVKPIDGDLSYDFVKQISSDIRILFSLIIGYNLAFENIWIKSSDNHRIPFYFLHQGEESDPFENDIECTLMPQHISKKNLWAQVIQNYFSKNIFDLIWSRLPFLLSFKGAWEYELLGYVSLLDAYCSEYAEKNRNKLNKRKFKEIKSDLLRVLSEHQTESDPISNSVFESIRSSVENIKNTNLQTLKEKFHALKGTVEPAILDVIALSDSHFDHIKKLRNQAAHGVTVTPKEKSNLYYEFAIRDKIKLLLTYFLYRDLGIDDLTFTSTLRSTTNRTVRNAFINSFARDKLIGDTPFYEVKKEEFKSVSSRSRHNLVLVHSKSSDLYTIDFNLTDKVENDWYSERYKEYKSVMDFLKSLATEHISVDYISHSYITCSEQHQELHGTCLITIE